MPQKQAVRLPADQVRGVRMIHRRRPRATLFFWGGGGTFAALRHFRFPTASEQTVAAAAATMPPCTRHPRNLPRAWQVPLATRCVVGLGRRVPRDRRARQYLDRRIQNRLLRQAVLRLLKSLRSALYVDAGGFKSLCEIHFSTTRIKAVGDATTTGDRRECVYFSPFFSSRFRSRQVHGRRPGAATACPTPPPLGFPHI